MCLQLEGLARLKGTLEPKNHFYHHFSHHDLSQISRGGWELSSEWQIISIRGQLGSTEISCSHRWSSCILQQSSHESSCPQTCWPPNGASCFLSGRQGSCCRSLPCHSWPWSHQTPSWIDKKINKVRGQIFSTLFTLFNTVHQSHHLVAFESLFLFVSPEFTVFCGILQDASFFSCINVTPFPGTGVEKKNVIIDAFIQRTLHSETQSSHCETETNVIKILASSPKLPGSNYQLRGRNINRRGGE